MFTANKFNKRKFTYQAAEEIKYTNLKGLYEKDMWETHTVHALFISNKGMFGDQPIALIDNYYVNLPQHLLSVVQNILEDEEAIAAINEGKFGFTVYPYDSNGQQYYSVKWADL